MTFFTKIKKIQVPVAYACNLPYNVSRDLENCGLKPEPWANINKQKNTETPHLK
jgi:hypothetical protein